MTIVNVEWISFALGGLCCSTIIIIVLLGLLLWWVKDYRPMGY